MGNTHLMGCTSSSSTKACPILKHPCQKETRWLKTGLEPAFFQMGAAVGREDGVIELMQREQQN